MGHKTCCVVNCKSTGRNSLCKFYRFPKEHYKLEQRRKWIEAVRKVNCFDWIPKPTDVICSNHFIGGEKSNKETSPAYIPTIFGNCRPSVINQAAAINRHARFVKRRMSRFIPNLLGKKDLHNKSQVIPMEIVEKSLNIDCDMNNELKNPINVNTACESTSSINSAPKSVDFACQASFPVNYSDPGSSFTCNRYIYSSGYCDSEVQTDIVQYTHPVVVNERKKFANKKCGTPIKSFVDNSVQVSSNDLVGSIHFTGFSSIKNSDQLIDLAGVSIPNFNLLLKKFKSEVDNYKISKQNRLLIFLIKMKTGLTFSSIAVLFNVHRTTVSRIFFSVLVQLASATANLVFWPDKDIVEGTMPQCFYPDYKDTRVIIDCTEFKIEVPATVDNRVYTYSHYKKGFTAKLLVGITPGGFISFKSKVAGGKKSDSQITIESGLIDLLEDGDVVLADKGFPDIRRTIDQKGKKVVVVMPPFLEKKTEFSKEETGETYNIAKIRIHVERIMQRLRTHQILNKIPENLFPYLDDIIHVCCVLVNLQPPIIAQQSDIESSEVSTRLILNT